MTDETIMRLHAIEKAALNRWQPGGVETWLRDWNAWVNSLPRTSARSVWWAFLHKHDESDSCPAW